MSNEKSQDSSHFLIEHKNRVCDSMLSDTKKAHLKVLLRLSEALYIDKGRFYSLSLAIEQTNKNIEDLTIGRLLEIIEEHEIFHTITIRKVSANL